MTQTTYTRRATTAETARRIKKELKARWPGIKFSVTSEGNGYYDAVNVRWIDGPADKLVDEMIGRYQGGYFDGMIDLYTHTDDLVEYGVRWDVKYVHTDRDPSPDVWERFQSLTREKFGNDPAIHDLDYRSKARRSFYHWDATTTPLPETWEELPAEY